ncbi:MAG: hypothetical protein ABIW30_02805 [Arenimonas sp.]
MERNALPKKKGTTPLVLSSARERISSGDRGSQRQGAARDGMRRNIGENNGGIARVRQQQDRQCRGQRKRRRGAGAHAAAASAVLALAGPVMGCQHFAGKMVVRGQHCAGRMMVAVLVRTCGFASHDGCTPAVMMVGRRRCMVVRHGLRARLRTRRSAEQRRPAGDRDSQAQQQDQQDS